MPSSLPFPHTEAIHNAQMKWVAAAKLALGKKVVLVLPGRAPLGSAVDQLGPCWQRQLQCVTGISAQDTESGGSEEGNGAAWRAGISGEQEAERKAELQVLGC